MLERKLIITSDGSTSISVPELDESYHSVHGAIQESMHVFINTGLNSIDKENISIFEMGFGTGLNALLSLVNSRKKIVYQTIEAYPVEPDMVKALNYVNELKLSTEQVQQFDSMHQCSWGEEVEISESFQFTKQQVKLKEFQSNQNFDLVYFDAFSPDTQPGLWTAAIFQKLFSLMNAGGILTTYCAKGQVRRNMQAAGFTLERLPGPPGKREILRATKK